MNLREIPLADLEKGDRFQVDKWNQGTIQSVDAETGVLTLRWDTGRLQEVLQTELFDLVTYEGRWKMYCVVNEVALKAMNGNRGKLGAQCGHGYQFADWDAQVRFPWHHVHYRKSMHSAKVCLKAPDEDVLREVEEAHRPICGVALITDAAHTVFKEPTVTVLGIGPIRTDKYGDMRLPQIQRGGAAGSILI